MTRHNTSLVGLSGYVIQQHDVLSPYWVLTVYLNGSMTHYSLVSFKVDQSSPSADLLTKSDDWTVILKWRKISCFLFCCNMNVWIFNLNIYHINFSVNKYLIPHEDWVTECTAVLADHSISHSDLKGPKSKHLHGQEHAKFFHELFLILMLWYGFINSLSFWGLWGPLFCEGLRWLFL